MEDLGVAMVTVKLSTQCSLEKLKGKQQPLLSKGSELI